MPGEEERRRLANVIQNWNDNRLDLFEISPPSKSLEFHGVMRFYFEDHAAENFATKCLRVCSNTTTCEIVETLSEKFRPDMKMLSTAYSLYEVHANEERKLDLSEKPLVVQLNWNSREGRFVLKYKQDIILQDNCQQKKEKGGVLQNFKRTLSRKEKKKEKKGDVARNNITKSNGQSLKKDKGKTSDSTMEKQLTNKDKVSNSKMGEQKHTTKVTTQDNLDQLGLPVGIKFKDNSTEAFLSAVINYTNSSTVHFKLSPAYALYMAARFVLHRDHNQASRASKHGHKVTSIVNTMVNMTEMVIQKQQAIAGAVAFWMANTSEFLNFIKQDRDLSLITMQAQEALAHLVHKAFKCLIQCLQNDLKKHMPVFLIDPEEPSNQPGIEGVLNTLMSAMSLLRRCRVNPALTIQLFSQLFHFISAWLFNNLMSSEASSLGLLSHYWGATLRQRLSGIEDWAERQGLELAADCHLSLIVQATMLLTMNKYSIRDVKDIQNTCFKLNSLQLRTLMSSYLYATNEPHIPPGLIDSVVAAAEAAADDLVRSEGRDIEMKESPDLHLPFLLPEGGYTCDTVRGIPHGFREFMEPICRKGLCTLTAHSHSVRIWTIFFSREMCFSARDTNPAIHREPEVVNITLKKPLNCGMGVSIVAARGVDRDDLGIYVKSIVKGGPAEMDGRLTAGDRLLTVDGQSLVGLSQERAAGIMMNTGPVVTLKVSKLGATYHGLAALLNEPPSIVTTALTDSGHSNAKPKGQALILYDGMEHGMAWSPSGPGGNHHGTTRRKREQTLLSNRQLYRSNPNMANPTLDEGEEPADPVMMGSRITAVSTSNLCSDTYARECQTLPRPRSQDKKTPADFQQPHPMSKVPVDGQISNKRAFMRQALSQENLCMERGDPLVDKRNHAWNQQDQAKDYQSHYSSHPMCSISTHDIHSNPTPSNIHQQNSRRSGPGHWRTPMLQNPTVSIQPIRIDIPVTRPNESYSYPPFTTFQQNGTLLAVKFNKNPEGQGSSQLSNQKQGSVSKRLSQPPPLSSSQLSQQHLALQKQTKPQMFPPLSKDTSLQKLPPQQGATPRQQDPQYFTMNQEPIEGNGLSPDPWKRDAREKLEKEQRLHVVDLLEQEVQELQAKANRTPEESDRLRRLTLEWQFQKRLQEYQQNGDDDEEEDEEDMDMMMIMQQLEVENRPQLQDKEYCKHQQHSEIYTQESKDLDKQAKTHHLGEEDKEKNMSGNIKGSNGLDEEFHKKWSNEGQEKGTFRSEAAPENLTFRERHHLFSLGSSPAGKVKALLTPS